MSEVALFDGDVFALAKARASVGGVLGVAGGARWRRLKLCPFCEGRDDFSYRDDVFRCWKCGESGDVVDLFAALRGLSRFDAACALAGLSHDEADAARKRYGKGKNGATAKPAARRRSSAPTRPRDWFPGDAIVDVKSQARCAALLRGAVPARGTLVEEYLRSRRIEPALVARALDRLLFQPRAVHTPANHFLGGPYEDDLVAPAMIAQLDGADEGAWGLHVTFLKENGRGKACLDPAKKMFGPQTDAFLRGRGIVLIPPAPGGLLIVAEGIENALSVAAEAPQAGAFAAGSLDRLQGGLARNAFGEIDWKSPRPGEAPAATIPHTGPVLVVVDSDMKPLVLNRGTQWERVIAPARRAQVSGLCAAHWWRVAGAARVDVLTPPPGMDANDVLRGARA